MDSLISDIEKNTSTLEQKQMYLQQTVNNLWTENMYLKNSIKNSSNNLSNIAQDISTIFQNPEIKKLKNEYINLNKLHLLLYLKYKLDKKQILDLFQNNPRFEIVTKKSKIFIKKH